MLASAVTPPLPPPWRRHQAHNHYSHIPIFLGPPPVPVMVTGGTIPLAPLAAALAESAVAIALAPVDNWKSRVQTNGIHSAAAAAASALGNALASPTIRSHHPHHRHHSLSFDSTSVPSVQKQLKRPRPPYRPFRGVLVSVCSAAMDSLVFMAVYRFLRRSLTSFPAPNVRAGPSRTKQTNLHATNQREDSSAPVESENPKLGPPLGISIPAVFAGAGASIFTALFSAPFDLVCERLRNGLHGSPSAALRAAISGPKQWKGLYVGVIPMICRDLPFETLEFAVFEAMRRWRLSQSSAQRLLSPRENLVLGMMTGALVGAAVAPLDLVVTRVLVSPERYSGLFASVRTIAKEEGFRGLFAGSVQKLSREAVASGLFFACYEAARAKLGVADEEDDD